jgi:formamidopyrimidine-DNA glycosylase
VPELPEVETVRRGLAACLPGTRAFRIELARTDLRWPIPVHAVRRLAERTCTAVERRAKYLLLHFDRDTGAKRPVPTSAPSTALVHLGMSGRLFVDHLEEGERLEGWREHEHWRMHFRMLDADSSPDLTRRLVMRYVDPRRFGSFDVCPTAELATHPRLVALGPEPLDATAFDGTYLYRVSRGRRIPVRQLLMDAHIVVGVGNIYASEACFRAGVRPGKAAGRLTRAACAALAQAVRETLADAITAGGTTLRDYVGVDESTGWFQLQLYVYGREGEPCRRCGTPIRRTVSNARSSFWCRVCQT